VRLRYFAWVRERIGVAEETVDLPAGIESVGEFLAWLSGRGEGYAAALERPAAIRVAVDQVHARPGDPIGNAREIALFPPMTGG
jgi:molybdopterin synthase sulfur carrier subunit